MTKNSGDWVLVSKEEFDKFIKGHMICIFMHRKGYEYYGSASRIARAKRNKAAGEYYINRRWM
jgi:hypothetical protein